MERLLGIYESKIDFEVFEDTSGIKALPHYIHTRQSRQLFEA
jgi:hypothetical protein